MKNYKHLLFISSFLTLFFCILNQSIAQDVSITINHPACPQNNGSIDMNIYEGEDGVIDGYAVNWVDSQGESVWFGLVGENQDFTVPNLPAGDYCVTVSNTMTACVAEGCITIEVIPMELDFDIIPVTTPGANNGEITLTITGGNPPYNITWYGPKGEVKTLSPLHLTQLAPGYYCVYIIDADGCWAWECVEIVECGEETPAPTVTFEVNDATCINQNDGSITAIIDGVSEGNYQMSWFLLTMGNPPDLQELWFENSETLENVYPTSDFTRYCIRVVDECGNRTLECTEVGTTDCSLCAAEFVENITEISCDGSVGGSIDLTVDGVTEPINYNWSNGATTEDISGITEPGYYCVTISNAAGDCLNDDCFYLDVEDIEITGVVTPICNETEGGSVVIEVSGCNGPYTYLWDTGATTKDLTNITEPDWNYTVTVTDADGCCVNIANFSVQYSFNLWGKVVNACGDADDGSISITRPDPGSGNYSYSWSNGATTAEANNLALGEYCVTVTDNADGCISVKCFEIENRNPTMLPGSVEYATPCFGEENGSICITVVGGEFPHVAYVLWSDGTFMSSTSTPHQFCLENIGAGDYSATIYNWTFCETVETFTLVSNPDITSEGGAFSACPNQNGGVLFTANGGTPPFTYLWSNGATSQDLSAGAGTYKVTVTDAIGCTHVSDDYTIILNTISVVSEIVTTTCYDEDTNTDYNNGEISLTITGPDSPYNYNWSTGFSESNTNSTTSTITDLPAGEYSVTVTGPCQFEYVYNYTVYTEDLIEVAVSNPQENECGYEYYCHDFFDESFIYFEAADLYLDYDNISFTEDCNSCDCKLDRICSATGEVMETITGVYSNDFTSGQSADYNCDEGCHGGNFCKKIHSCYFASLDEDIVVKEELSTVIKIVANSGNCIQDSITSCQIQYICGESTNPPFHTFTTPNCCATTDPNDTNYPLHPCNLIVLPWDCFELGPGPDSDGLTTPSNTTIVFDQIAVDQEGDKTITTYKPETMEKNSILIRKVFPNPFKNSLNIDMLASYTGKTSIRIFDTLGREVKDFNKNVQKGSNLIKLEFSGLNQGVYFIHMRDEFNNIYTTRVVYAGND